MHPPTVIEATADRLTDCLEFDQMAISGSVERREELSLAAREGRMRIATLNDRAVGYSVVAPWFLGAAFLALLYVDPAMRGRGIGFRLLEDFEGVHGPQVFTSTNLSNEPMQRLLRLRLWKPCGMLNGLDEGDPEIFFSKAL
jgi:ribosomal protein S18 acetylase RimI-like enzyme